MMWTGTLDGVTTPVIFSGFKMMQDEVEDLSRDQSLTPEASFSPCAAEIAVGIEEYINMLPTSFSGILKHR